MHEWMHVGIGKSVIEQGIQKWSGHRGMSCQRYIREVLERTARDSVACRHSATGR